MNENEVEIIIHDSKGRYVSQLTTVPGLVPNVGDSISIPRRDPETNEEINMNFEVKCKNFAYQHDWGSGNAYKIYAIYLTVKEM